MFRSLFRTFLNINLVLKFVVQVYKNITKEMVMEGKGASIRRPLMTL